MVIRNKDYIPQPFIYGHKTKLWPVEHKEKNYLEALGNVI